MTRRLAGLVLGALLLSACGSSGPQGVLRAAADSLDSVRTATVDLTLAARAPSGGDVGFRVRGPFQLPQGGGLPTADLTYTQLRGAAPGPQVRVLSTTAGVVVQSGGTTRRLTPAQAAPLRLPPQTHGLGGLHVDRWVVHPVRAAGPSVDGVATDAVSGSLDLAQLLADLDAVIGDAGTDPLGLTTLSPADLARLQSSVSSSRVTVLTGHADHLLRDLHAQADLGSSATGLPPGLRALLPVTLRLDLTLRRIGAPVAVTLPGG